MSSRGKRLCGLAAPAAALVLAGGRSSGQLDHGAVTHVALNECNGEEVAVQGTVHLEDHSTITPNGTHFQFTINLAGVKGVAMEPLTTFATTCAST